MVYWLFFLVFSTFTAFSPLPLAFLALQLLTLSPKFPAITKIPFCHEDRSTVTYYTIILSLFFSLEEEEKRRVSNR
jgi:hypothetical protein